MFSLLNKPWGQCEFSKSAQRVWKASCGLNTSALHGYLALGGFSAAGWVLRVTSCTRGRTDGLCFIFSTRRILKIVPLIFLPLNGCLCWEGAGRSPGSAWIWDARSWCSSRAPACVSPTCPPRARQLGGQPLPGQEAEGFSCHLPILPLLPLVTIAGTSSVSQCSVQLAAFTAPFD